jgi:pyruvate/2-oxoglutarate dehydrogenase complex dihydrolipoamide acyltransferase (E2) component
MSAPDRIPVLLPDLGGEEPVRVATWLVEPGETVETGDRLVEVLLPGVLVYVTAPAAGTLAAVERRQGAHAAPGDVLAWVESVVPQGGLC